MSEPKYGFVPASPYAAQPSTDDDFFFISSGIDQNTYQFERIGSIKLLAAQSSGKLEYGLPECRSSSKESEIEWVGRDYEFMAAMKRQIFLTVKDICWLIGVVDGSDRVADFVDSKLEFILRESEKMLNVLKPGQPSDCQL